jgi:hypothetical protein
MVDVVGKEELLLCRVELLGVFVAEEVNWIPIGISTSSTWSSVAAATELMTELIASETVLNCSGAVESKGKEAKLIRSSAFLFS